MATKKRWTLEEEKCLAELHQQMTCSEIAKKIGRTTRSVQHKFRQLGLEKRRAKEGEIVNGWMIDRVFQKHNGHQYVTYAEISSTVDDQTRVDRLSRLTNNQIGHPIRVRPDLVERNTTHGMSNTRIHNIWLGVKNRDRDKTHANYRHVDMCDEWKNFSIFMNWSYDNGYQDELSLDRIENSKGYSPDNCRWVDRIEQNINKDCVKDFPVTAFGITQHAIRWSYDDRCVVTSLTLRNRITAGWNAEKAITQPSQRGRKLNVKNWLKENHPSIYEEYLKS